MWSFSGRSVLVAGGAQGLGVELARGAARSGARLALVGPDALDDAAAELRGMGAQAVALRCDTSAPAQVERAMDEAVRRHGGVDALFNDAGMIEADAVEAPSLRVLQASIDGRLQGALHCIRAALPRMRRQGGGRIVNVAWTSVAAANGRFAVLGLSRSLRHELRRQGIDVTVVCPGAMRSGSHLRALLPGQDQGDAGWFAILAGSTLARVDAAHAARQVLEACRRGQPELTLEAPRAAGIFDGLVPGLLGVALGAAGRSRGA
jgi:NAD(P)-dependent dehydrogenase (short-subunit alcohol dehydrogenase family)